VFAAATTTLPSATSTSGPAAHLPIEPVHAVPNLPHELVDPGEANLVATQLWNDRVLARHTADAAAYRSIETGPILETDLADTCGCHAPRFTADQVLVNVPHQQHWPLAFFATVKFTSDCQTPVPPCDDSFVAIQNRRDAPWRIALYVAFSGQLNATQPAELDYNWAAPANNDPVIAGALGDYAAYLSVLNRTGRPPAHTLLMPGPFTIGYAPAYIDERRAATNAGIDKQVTYSIDKSQPIWRYAASGGVQVACGTLRFSNVQTSFLHAPLVQPLDRTSFGAPLAPGKYASVTTTGIHMACFETVGANIRVFGDWDDGTRTVGAPFPIAA
jgi:hypothetical protein